MSVTATRTRKPRNRSLARLENLESRTLLSGITSYTVAVDELFGGSAQISSLAVDNLGNIWVADSNFAIDKITPNADGSLTSVTVNAVNYFASAVAFSSANNHLYAAGGENGNEIVEIDPTNGAILHDYVLDFSVFPLALAAGADGSIWFTAIDAGQSAVGRIDAQGNTSVIDLAVAGQVNGALSIDSAGTAWVTVASQSADAFSQIAEISAAGTLHQVNVYDLGIAGEIEDIHAVGAGQFWFAVAGDGFTNGQNSISFGSVSNGVLTETDHIITNAGDPAPSALAVDAQGRIWFSEFLNNKLSYFDPTSQSFTSMALPGNAVAPGSILITSTDVWVGCGAGEGDDLVRYQFPQIPPDPGTTFEGNGVNISGHERVAVATNATVDNQNVLELAIFTGPVFNYTATINFGDSTFGVGTVVSLGNNTYAVIYSGSKTYGSQGLYHGNVHVTGATSALDLNFDASISDTALTASTGLPLGQFMGHNFNGTVAFFSDDVTSVATWFTAVITWGDGSTSAGIVVKNLAVPGSYSVIGRHTYTKKSVYNISVLITNIIELDQATATATICIGK